MRIAVITMVFNERRLLPIWLNHYGAQFGYENLYVIDDGSTDGSTRDSRIVNLINKARTDLDEDDRAYLVSCLHERLLEFYDVVAYTDCDELISVDPRIGMDLKTYIEDGNFAFNHAVGFNIIHRIDREPDLNIEHMLFDQRSFLQFDINYSKRLIARQPIRWVAGFHRSDVASLYDLHLILFHLRAVDQKWSLERLREFKKVTLSASSLAKQHAAQYRLPEPDYVNLLFGVKEEAFENAFHGEISDLFSAKGDSVHGSIMRVPPSFKDSIALSALDLGPKGTESGRLPLR